MKKTSHFKRTDNSQGYSLVEIVTTVAIVAILSAISLPVLNRMFATPPESEEIERLRRAFTEIRNRTIMADVCATAVVNGSELRTTVYRTCGPPLSDPVNVRTILFNRLTFSNFDTGSNTLALSPGGAVTSRQVTALRITTQSNRVFEIKVLPAIGSIRLNEKRIN